MMSQALHVIGSQKGRCTLFHPPLTSLPSPLPPPSPPSPLPRALEHQLLDVVMKVLDGQGISWPKPPGLKRLASQEKTRVMVLRLLEVKLGLRKPDSFSTTTQPQIQPVVSHYHDTICILSASVSILFAHLLHTTITLSVCYLQSVCILFAHLPHTVVTLLVFSLHTVCILFALLLHATVTLSSHCILFANYYTTSCIHVCLYITCHLSI